MYPKTFSSAIVYSAMLTPVSAICEMIISVMKDFSRKASSLLFCNRTHHFTNRITWAKCVIC